jgi:hypothetical protein
MQFLQKVRHTYEWGGQKMMTRITCNHMTNYTHGSGECRPQLPTFFILKGLIEYSTQGDSPSR